MLGTVTVRLGPTSRSGAEPLGGPPRIDRMGRLLSAKAWIRARRNTTRAGDPARGRSVVDVGGQIAGPILHDRNPEVIEV